MAVLKQALASNLLRVIDMNEIIEDPASATLASKAIERANLAESYLRDPEEPGISDVERQNRTLIMELTKVCGNYGKTWPEHLQFLEYE